MRAKTINEIVRAKSGLGPLGVGHTEIIKTYIKLNNRWPEWFNEKAEKLDSVFKRFSESAISNKVKDRINYYKEVFEEYSDDPLSNFICINIYQQSETFFTEIDELSFDMGFDWDDAYEMFNEEMDNGRKVTFSSKLDYLRKFGVGILYLNNAEKPYDQIMHYVFVKYK